MRGCAPLAALQLVLSLLQDATGGYESTFHKVAGKQIKRADVEDWLQPGCYSRGSEPTRCTSGPGRTPAWATLERVKAALPEFASLYHRRPVRFNFGGMGINHCFAMWYTVKVLQPPVVIESGVFMGQGTWLIRQAAPSTRIISLDPRPASTFTYRDPMATYLAGVFTFRDFGILNWSQPNLIPDAEERSRTLVILDDHQSAIKRTMELMRPWGFRHLWYEDNWARGRADCYSFSVMCAAKSSASDKIVYMDEFTRHKGMISHEEHEANVAFLLAHMEEYVELPPVYDVCTGSDRLGNDGQRRVHGISISTPDHGEIHSLLASKAEADALFASPNSTNLFGEYQSLIGHDLTTFFPPYVKLRYPINEALWKRTTPCRPRPPNPGVGGLYRPLLCNRSPDIAGWKAYSKGQRKAHR